ncbi:MAG TPA: glycosyltransferase, partial [Roseiflexaceae bacterium]|nr:glycosyltransferase [Roseiflexaceae bacterium]
LPLFYSAADIITMPSHYESFGMAALEGLASGRPVVATNAGGPAYIVEDGKSGLLTPPDDPSALAARLLQLLDNDELRETLGVGARRRAQRFGWATVGCDILQIYREVLAPAQRAALAV